MSFIYIRHEKVALYIIISDQVQEKYFSNLQPVVD